MKNERQTAEVIRTWMKEEVELNDTGVHRVLARVPDTPQRKHRWLWPFDRRPFGPGATRSADAREATPDWRFRSMFTPIRVAAVTTVLALTGTLALVSGPLAPTGPAALPGAEGATVSMEPAHFTGLITAWDTGTTEVESLPDRTIQTWPVAWRNLTDDPRVNGEGESMDYLETIQGADGVAVVSHSGHGRLTTDDGTWAVACEGAATSLESEDGYIFCWYEGEAAYEGLTAFVVLTMRSDGAFDTEGWIFPGQRPSLLPFEP